MDEYHNFYVQSDTLLLADTFNNFLNMCLEICDLGPPHFLHQDQPGKHHRKRPD